MTDVELKLNAWTDNPGTSVFAVQGEQESRTLHVTLIDRTGVNSDVMSVAKVTPRYIDLTGYAARLYVVKSDSTKVYFPGEITDAENGKVDFTLTGQCVAAPGKAECTIVLTKEDVELKIVGIVLDVRENDLEGSIESSDEWVELDVMLTKAQEAIDACETATNAANSAASSATSKITEMDQLKGELQTAEAARVKAEEGRVSAESTRVSQESARQSAEQQRQTDSAAAVSAANTAAGSANTAADRANKAAEAIEGTDVGDLAVRVQDLEGEMDTVNDTINGLNVQQMQQDITALGDEMDTAQQDISQLQTGLSGKVDKVSGKGLSTCDYTTAEKEKLAELENYNDSSLRTRISDLESATRVVTGASIVTNGSKTKLLTFRRMGHIAFCQQTLPADSWFDLGSFDGSSSEYTIGTIPDNFVPKVNVGIKLSSKGCIVLAESGKIVAMPEDNKLVGTWCSSIYYVD